MLPYIITAVVSVLVAAAIVWLVSDAYHKNSANSKIGNAEEKAREIIDEAVKTAETKKREALLEAKEENIKAKNELDKEIKERRNEMQRNERRVVQKEESLDKKLESIEKREAVFAVKEEELNKQKAQIAKLNEERIQELERISGLTSEQAKEYLLKAIEEDVKIDTAKMIKESETRAKEEANKRAKEYVVTAIQKCAADHVSETTISVVQLPNDEM
jgi:ribonuclease Y